MVQKRTTKGLRYGKMFSEVYDCSLIVEAGLMIFIKLTKRSRSTWALFLTSLLLDQLLIDFRPWSGVEIKYTVIMLHERFAKENTSGSQLTTCFQGGPLEEWSQHLTPRHKAKIQFNEELRVSILFSHLPSKQNLMNDLGQSVRYSGNGPIFSLTVTIQRSMVFR